MTDGHPTEMSNGGAGRVILVGAGPGDPGLMTVAGRAAVEGADVILTDRLVSDGVLQWARADTRIVPVGKEPYGAATPQEEINRLLIEHALAGSTVVRLKGGDPYLFGRGREEVDACMAAGVAVEVIPGVPSATSVPELVGIPVTHRGTTQGFTVISGHLPPSHPGSTLDYDSLAKSGTTIVVLMGVRTLPQIAEALLAAGMAPETPAAVIVDGATPRQRLISATLASVAKASADADVRPPAIAVIGEVAALGLAP